jgi:hypothetical protein
VLAASGFDAPAGRSPRVVARRNRVGGNAVATRATAATAVEIRADGGGQVDLGDSLVFRNDPGGVHVAASDNGRVELVNLTVADHQGTGLRVSASDSKVLLANTILFGNAPDLTAFGPVLRVANLVGVDPLFVDAAVGDYRLQVRSPAVDAGAGPPRVELGPSDVDGAARVQGFAVDVGAHELPPGCRVLWTGVDRATAACRCLSDPGLRQFRCGFFLPDVFLSLRMPLPPRGPGEPVEAAWTVHPWTDVAGSYSMAASALIGDEWVGQEWLGPTASELKEGRLVVEPFRLKLPAEGATPLQTALKYHRLSVKDPLQAVVELLLPPP